ncbi:MAG: hypothetical protein ACE5G1_16370, partial [bacterium]
KELEELLLRYFSGTLTAQDAQRFMDALLFSPMFFRRLFVKLDEANPELEADKLGDKEAIEIKTDDEVVAAAVRLVKRGGEKGGLVVTGGRGGFLNIIDNLIDLLSKVPSYAFGIVLVAIIAVAGYAIFNKIAENRFYAQFDYTSKVPYEPLASSIRAGAALGQDDPQFGAVVDQFEIGLGHYLAWDYRPAIEIFQRIASGTEFSELSGLAPDRGVFWRDFYFYFGVSHLALFTSERSELSEQEKQAQLSAAIANLSNARSLVKEFGLAKGDRELYFLGLAYGLAQQTGKAIELLQQIGAESGFYADSQSLVRRWSE